MNNSGGGNVGATTSTNRKSKSWSLRKMVNTNQTTFYDFF